MSKKSQAALEFLTTYVWAFMAISVTIAALYYLGVFDISSYLPQKCVFSSQFKCIDFALKPGEVRLKLANNLGETICIKSIQITTDSGTPICTPPLLPQGSCTGPESEWAYGAQQDFIFTSCSAGNYIPGERIGLKMSMAYYAINTKTKPIHLVNGKINGKITS